MRPKWYLLYATQNSSTASIVQGMLQQNNVPAMVVNKQDSSYVNFGEIEIWVPASSKDLAKQLLDQRVSD